MKLIERSYYLNKLHAVKDIPDIKVITGLRRSGKSKLLDAYANILERETTNNVIRIPLLVARIFIPYRLKIFFVHAMRLKMLQLLVFPIRDWVRLRRLL